MNYKFGIREIVIPEKFTSKEYEYLGWISGDMDRFVGNVCVVTDRFDDQPQPTYEISFEDLKYDWPEDKLK